MPSNVLSTLLVAALAALVSTGKASPVGDASFAARDAPWGNLYVCTDANWSGNCDNIWFQSGQCVVFPGDFQNDISSIGPPKGWGCNAYVDYNCADDGLDFLYPGIYDLGDGNTNYNDRLNSFSCFALPGSGQE
ncbi:hypothetical protein PsYK624_034240 [Phanerochaete sordida]|uniref:Uncharacterized protein n=1 Tax=Phanerochaete sordida TaxID=48140 RepID=A0A9P3L9J6_9APHY|nr:hypothetical protein PsYK624_034240 [Phanerochaete sordida]